MKEWKKPEIEKLNIKATASGGDPSTSEANGYFSGGWHNATYDAVNWEKCEGQGSVTPKKSSAAS